ncbi:MAG: histidine kinase dimerization/phosphoacceptor domain -containing protein [Paracoccaceae bacterium]|nr:histidine kinase dimerization/phosphoacceptor domain -containing protein [Paracoccaceae bacterium]
MTLAPQPEPRKRKRGRITDLLGFRMVLLFAVAMLPLGLVAIQETAKLRNEARGRAEAALLGETLQAASWETSAILRSQGIAASLSKAILPYLEKGEDCAQVMQMVAASEPRLSLVAYIPLSGKMTCSSLGVPFDFTKDPLFAQFIAKQEPSFIVNPEGPVAGVSVLGISHPVTDMFGRYIGIISLSMPHLVFELKQFDRTDQGLRLPRVLITFDLQGTVLTSSVGLSGVAAELPAKRKLSDFVGTGKQVFSSWSEGGEDRVFSVVPLVSDKLYLMAAWDAAEQDGGILERTPYIFPMLMWIASLLVALLASERLVTRHIHKLRRSITAFGRGNRLPEVLNMHDAPLELREVAEAFNRMTGRIERDAAELENLLTQKDVLLREVHHRVKNNLQLIASIMNMQMRMARSPEAKSLMRGLQDRVMSLATIHKELYLTSGLTHVRADELLPVILRQLVNMSHRPGYRVEVETEIDPVPMTPDQAVPLSLLLTEALTNALKYMGSEPGAAPRLSVTLKRLLDGRAALEVCNTTGPQTLVAENEPDLGSGLGSQLLDAFSRQLDGEVTIIATDGEYRLRLEFLVQASVTDAEGEGKAAAEAGPDT